MVQLRFWVATGQWIEAISITFWSWPLVKNNKKKILKKKLSKVKKPSLVFGNPRAPTGQGTCQAGKFYFSVDGNPENISHGREKNSKIHKQ